MKHIAVIACVAFMLNGCVAVGNERIKGQTQSSVAEKITEGKSTKADILAAYGDATTVSFTDSGNEIWTYTYTRATPTPQSFIPVVNIFTAGANTATTGLVVLFDRNGIVSKYTMRETQGVVKQGIAQ